MRNGNWSSAPPARRERDGGALPPATHSPRRIVDAILYVARTGCAWRQLPPDFPSWKTVYWYFMRWNANGTLDHLHNALREKVRIAEGRNAEPTAGIVDAQSIRGADTVGKNSRGYDAGRIVRRAPASPWVRIRSPARMFGPRPLAGFGV
jgi:transposase